jgi:hypothetical protein
MVRVSEMVGAVVVRTNQVAFKAFLVFFLEGGVKFGLVFLLFEDVVILFELLLIVELSTILSYRFVLLLFIINW